jgi:hypothetical protein
MASQRTTFEKLQRERNKRAKQAAKRERRHDRTGAEDGPERGPVGDDSAEDLLDQIAALHEAFEAKQIDFDTFEEQKLELFERLASLPIDG